LGIRAAEDVRLGMATALSVLEEQYFCDSHHIGGEPVLILAVFVDVFEEEEEVVVGVDGPKKARVDFL
jgi:hypothetical protein